MTTLAYRLMLVMVFTLPWESVVDLPGDGRLSKLVGVLAALAWMGMVVSTGRIREPHAVHLLALLFVLWNACSLMWTVDGPATQERVLTYVQLFGLILVVWDLTTTRAAVRQTLLAYLAGTYVTVTALLVGYLTQGTAAEVNGRVTVGDFHPNDVGMILALGVPVASYFILVPGEERWRTPRVLACVAYLPLAGFAVLVTGSRAALVAMLPGVLYLGFHLARRRPGVVVGGVAGLAALTTVALPFVPADSLTRLVTTEDALKAGDLNERTEVWAEAVRIIQDHPLVGIGGGAFRAAAVGVDKVGHNFVLALLAEVGVIGFALFAAILVVGLISVRRMAPAFRGMWLAIFTSWMFAALLHNWEYRKQTWFFFVLVVACGALSEQRQRRSDEREAERSLGRVP